MQADRKIFVISDTHFGHENIIQYCKRPFRDVGEMNRAIIENWNRVVEPHDIVYHLGDVYMKDPSVLSALNGRKRLILGNHDNGKDQNLHAAFQKITMWRMFPEYNCVLTHAPIHIDPNGQGGDDHAGERKSKWQFNVHGHIHHNRSPTKWHINACVERIGYKPIELARLVTTGAG